MGMTNRIFMIFVIVAVIMSFVIGIYRLKVENENYAVEIIVEMSEIKYISEIEGIPLEEVVRKLINSGITSVLVDEYTINQIVQEHQMTILTGKDILSYYYIADFPNVFIKRLVEDGAIRQDNTYLLTEDSNLADRLVNAINLRVPEHLINTFDFHSYTGQQRYGIELPFNVDVSSGLTIGFSVDELEFLDRMGVNIVPRLTHHTDLVQELTHDKNMIHERIDFMFEQLSTIDSLSTIVFSGNYVPGHSEFIPFVAQRIEQLELTFGNLEFVNQRGEEHLSELLDFQVVRVQRDLRSRYAVPDDVDVDRFVRAVRERNIRGVIVKFYPETSGTNFDKGQAYIENFRSALRERGFYFSRAVPFRMLPSDLISVIVIGLGVAGATCILVYLMLNINAILSLLLLLCIMAVYILLIVFGHEILARQLMSLLSAIVFPIMAVIFGLIVTRVINKEGAKGPGVLGGIFRALVILLLVCGVSLVGGILVLGLLAHTRFMLNVNGFMGVKLSYMLPPVILICAYFFRYVQQRNNETTVSSIKRLLAYPVTYHHMAIIAIMGIIGGVYIIRSADLSTAVVSEIELNIRAFLEQQLYARPRTKEILVGHPFLFLALYKMVRKRRENILIYFILGIIGQISIINSFAHIHTPLFVTLSRIGYGFLFGVIVSGVLVLIYELICYFIKRTDVIEQTGIARGEGRGEDVG